MFTNIWKKMKGDEHFTRSSVWRFAKHDLAAKNLQRMSGVIVTC